MAEASGMKKKTRPLGEILLEMEMLLNEAMNHGLQWGDMLALVHSWLMIHRPGDREEYTEGGNPEFYYGPKRGNE
jgi:hypothetical protein